ncbi:hypothetical protein SCUCBS95973_001822 [Sporothrix curviconia]|uniref:Bactericidal permeability-increasing protein n=1 Tax=Sporothrix curviconia TaxID=1260050 RepID=A0ABP0B1S5_9PEZI
MSFCGFCGLCGGTGSDYDDDDGLNEGERRPLLANGDEETENQRVLHQKLHTYQMVRAMGSGYLPSTAQAVANLRRIVPEQQQQHRSQPHHGSFSDLSPSGRALSQLSTRFVEQLITLLEHKNGGDQIQDFVYCVQRARLDVNVDVDLDVGQIQDQMAYRAGMAMTQANAAYRSLETVGTLLLTNTPFRLFLTDLTAIGRDVFRDTTLSLADASHQAAKNVDKVEAITGPEPAPAADNVAAVTGEVVAGASKVAADARESISAKLVDNDEGARDRLVGRLKQAVGSLRQRPDYSESVSILTMLLQQYVAGYVRAAETVIDAVEEAVDDVREGVSGPNVSTNEQADVALRNFWSFLTAFGDPEAWKQLEKKFHALLDRSKGDNKRVDSFLRAVGRTLEEMLTDPAFFDNFEERIGRLQRQAEDLQDELASSSTSSSTSIREDMEGLLDQAKATLMSVANDRDVSNLVATSTRIADLLWPSEGSYVNTDLLSDAALVFVPRLVEAIQYIPIPRLEVVSPDVDLLLEGLVLEPGKHTDVQSRTTKPQRSSFLPYRLQVQIRNDIDIHKTQVGDRHGSASSVGTAATITIRGLSVAADDFGYVLRVHANPLFRFTDTGKASFHVDERGVDVRLDVDVIRGAADRVMKLKRVHVRIHHLDFSLHQSKVSWLAWLFKPLLRTLLRETLERQLAEAIKENLQKANQEVVFARERLRAAQVATAQSGTSTLGSIVPVLRAVFSRFEAWDDENPEVDVSIGIHEGSTGVFEGVYAPGSLVRVWREEAVEAQQRIDEDAAGRYNRDGWRNKIFDVPVAVDEE